MTLASPKMRPPKRKTIALSQESLVTERRLQGGSLLPLVIEPAVEGLSLVDWTHDHCDQIMKKVLRHGGVLFRSFKVSTTEGFERFMQTLCGDLLEYSYRSTPRTQVTGKIYTSTEYPAHQTIPLHNEMSYTRQWPMMLGFFCVEPATEGGETPIADSRAVFNRIDPAIRQRFSQRDIMYVRNYGDLLDLPWRDVFQTHDRGVVEEFCLQAGIEFAWQDRDRLRTSQVCQAVATHPRTGETVWFNQAHLFHVSSLKTEIRESLLASSEDQLPRNAFYGDGAPIDDQDLDQIRAAYDSEAVVFPWQKGDILLVDNMLVAHGRRPYRGARKIVVGMAEQFSSQTA